MEVQARIGDNYIIINKENKNKDYMLVDGVTHTFDINSILDNVYYRNAKIVVDLAEHKELEKDYFNILYHSLSNSIYVITGNVHLLDNLEEGKKVGFIDFPREIEVNKYCKDKHEVRNLLNAKK